MTAQGQQGNISDIDFPTKLSTSWEVGHICIFVINKEQKQLSRQETFDRSKNPSPRTPTINFMKFDKV